MSSHGALFAGLLVSVAAAGPVEASANAESVESVTEPTIRVDPFTSKGGADFLKLTILTPEKEDFTSMRLCDASAIPTETPQLSAV
eukprot:3030054-Prymnesium_polylepis.1